MKNPLINVKEDISRRPDQNLPFFEKMGLISVLIISVAILIFSGLSFIIDLFVKFDYLYGFVDLAFIIISLSSVFFVYKAFSRRVITDALVDTAFQEGIYSRLEPMIENIAQAYAGTNIVLDRLSNLDLKVENILKERYERDIRSSDFMNEPVAFGTSIKFALKAVVLTTLSMAFFIFLSQFGISGSMTPYAILLIFIMWWGFITNEYNLWKETSAWTAVFFVILVIPATVIALGFGNLNNVILALTYVFLGLYTLVYYFWAIFVTTGSLPFIVTEKKKSTGGGFFASQEKSMLGELYETFISRLERKLREDTKNQEPGYAWKK
ncbi:MAG TPA: hypothetical protein VIO11_10410 [Candidatus Methanoperedens sp.]